MGPGVWAWPWPRKRGLRERLEWMGKGLSRSKPFPEHPGVGVPVTPTGGLQGAPGSGRQDPACPLAGRAPGPWLALRGRPQMPAWGSTGVR